VCGRVGVVGVCGRVGGGVCVCMCVDARARKKPRERKDERENKVQKRAGKLKRGGFCPGAGKRKCKTKKMRAHH
jgi:hypothetical protein